jgi:hypothetical protein
MHRNVRNGEVPVAAQPKAVLIKVVLCALIVSARLSPSLEMNRNTSGLAVPTSELAKSGKRRREEKPVVQITFARSGGFVAAPGMKIRGTIDLKADGTAEVNSSDGGYHRELSSQEALMLRQTAGSIDFPKLQTKGYKALRPYASRSLIVKLPEREPQDHRAQKEHTRPFAVIT